MSMLSNMPSKMLKRHGTNFIVLRNDQEVGKFKAVEGEEGSKFVFSPDSDIEPGDWLKNEATGEKFFVEDTKTTTVEGKAAYKSVVYQTEKEHEKKISDSGKEGVEINVGDVDADMVAIGQDISQDKIVDKTLLKETIDETKELTGEEKDTLKKSVDRLEKELEKTNPDKTVIGEILGQIKDKGVDLLVGLTSSYLYQKFLTGI